MTEVRNRSQIIDYRGQKTEIKGKKMRVGEAIFLKKEASNEKSIRQNY
jgi:hypothetical protein